MASTGAVPECATSSPPPANLVAQQQQQKQQEDDKNIPLTPIAQRNGISKVDNLTAATASLFPVKFLPPRVVERNLPFHQSKSRFAVYRKSGGWRFWWLLRHDWFHVFLNLPTCFSLSLLLMTWTLFILVFGAIYMRLDRNSPEVDCGMGKAGDPIDLGGGFFFALQTATTVGYTLPSGSNAMFEHCPGLRVAIYFQMVFSMMSNAFLFAFFYTRVARPNNRGVQVLFSQRAIVSAQDDENQQVRFQVRVYDMDARHPVVEAHVRLYCLSRDRPVPRLLRVLQPNDELGALLFMSMPTVVSHHVDVFSMLHPPVADFPINPGGLVLRQVDSQIINRQEVVCRICGESFGNWEQWVVHSQYLRLQERQDQWPIEGSHQSLSDQELHQPPPYPITDIAQLRQHFENEISEVVVVVEGIDPVTSGTFQALQSYRLEDIVWEADARFQPCLDVNGGKIQVDLDHFHEIIIENNAVPKRNMSPRRRSRRRVRMHSTRPQDSIFPFMSR